MTYLTQLTAIQRAMIPLPLQNQMNSEEDFENFMTCYGEIVENKKFPEHLISATEKLKAFILSPKKEEVLDVDFISRIKEISTIVWPKYCKIKAIQKQAGFQTKEVEKKKIPGKQSEIIEGLFLGSYIDALKISKSNTEHYILSLVSLSKSTVIPIEIKHFSFIVSSVNWEALIQETSSDKSNPSKWFDKAFAVFNEALALNIPIFVHCISGKERSPALVIAYLMKTFKYTYENAYQLVKKARPEIEIEEKNNSLREGLKSYEDRLRERQIAKHKP